jgi:hypothetical protein
MPSTQRFSLHLPKSRRVWPLAFALFLAPMTVQAQEAQIAPPLQDTVDTSQPDPPSVVARISVLNGNVSLQPASVTDFTPAGLNYPLTTGDRLYTDNGADAELETGQVSVRLGSQTDLTVTAMTDQLEQFGLAQGSVHLRTFTLDQGTTLELDTPNAAVTVLGAGDVRVDVNPDTDTTVFTLLAGQAQVEAQGFQQALQPGESLQLTGANPVTPQEIERTQPDDLDRFSAERDDSYQGAASSEEAYVDPNTIGAEDLDGYGDWDNSAADGGPVWYPAGVAADWQPYRYGRWAWIAPWGWTWVEAEPWGFAPFHYGRWARFGNRWGWSPGPRVRRPVYAPALVMFVGGAGVTAWFPLGPHEHYEPWYHASVRYQNRVNENLAGNGATTFFNPHGTGQPAVANHAYVNRQIATVAMPQQSFASGQPVARNALRTLPPQLASAPLLSHPQVTPTREIVASIPARAVPRQIARPVLETRVPQSQPVSSPATSSASEVYTTGGKQPVSPSHEGANNSELHAAPAARPLVNRAVPPPPSPSFEQQRQAMENTEPGRPLSPRQMDNVRENRPVGLPQQQAPHFAPPPPHPMPQPVVHTAPAPISGGKH